MQPYDRPVSDRDEPAAAAHPRWRRQPGASWRRSLRGVVVLAPGADEPLTVTGSGRDIWDLLARPRSTEDLVSALSEQFAADPASIRPDVVALVARLAAAGALEELPGPDA